MLGLPTDFWGKLSRDVNEQVIAWHPLIDHCVDVAACAEALLKIPGFANPLARLGGFEHLPPVLVARLSVIAGLHDLGKFNHGFQNKSNQTHPQAGHVKEFLDVMEAQGQDCIRVCDALDFVALQKQWGQASWPLLQVAICHHGRPINASGQPQETLWAAKDTRDPMEGMHRLLKTLRQMFVEAWSDGPPLPESSAFAHDFAGLVMLADWLGSDRAIFPFSDALDDRPTFARKQASFLIQEMFLDPQRARTPLNNLPSEFYNYIGRHPRIAQQALFDLPLPTTSSLTLLEAETGSGKTEAAFSRFIQLFRAGKVDGMYFALPTRAAATQIHHRILQLTQNLFGDDAPPVILAVPGYMRVDDKNACKLSSFEVLWAETTHARAWAAEAPKRYLAGAIVVGTIDQVLLSTLQVSHAHMRATALLRSFLVVDEVHASDVYMNQILEEVLRHHLDAGGHALLMSATLGSYSHSRFLSLYQRKPVIPPLAETEIWSYPRIVAQQSTRFDPTIPSSNLSKTVEVKLLALADQPDAIAIAALAAARKGACVLILRNTVKDCIATQLALESLAGLDSPLLFRAAGQATPHHSRYAPADRQCLDTALELAFGPADQADRPRAPFVVVATQTVQQSLDIDADFLLTDLCPMDVLLQRIGRLHRHQRPHRPVAFAVATCHVLVPENPDLSVLINKDGKAWGDHGFGTVYKDLRILAATWNQISARPVWELPRDNRILVENSLHPEILAKFSGPLWGAHARLIHAQFRNAYSVADFNIVNWKESYLKAFKDDERIITTRLSDDEANITLELRTPIQTIFGNTVRELKAPARLMKEQLEPKIQNIIQDSEGFIVEIEGGIRVRYGRLGMMEG